MTVQLSSNFEEFVRKLVETGRFNSDQEVIEAGVAKPMLDSMESSEEEIDAATAAAIQRAEEQIRNGQIRNFGDAICELRKKHFGK